MTRAATIDEIVARMADSYRPERVDLFGSAARGDAWAGVLFHCQQAAEKALKAMLTWHQRPLRKTHALSELGPECLALDDTLTGVLKQAGVVTQYARRFGCPGAPYEPDAEETADGIQRASLVVAAIVERVPRS
jgi:HEPN domain-containing protein